MGGFGSGRPRSGRRWTVESCASIDVNALRREGRLRPGLGTIVCLSPGDEHVGVFADHEGLRLTRRLNITGKPADAHQTVGLVRRPCHLGGERPYFVCSGLGTGHFCGRRVVKLYAPGRYFLCRHCLGLAYASQNEDALGRAQLRASRTRKRITRDTDINAPLPFLKPRHMHWRTFSRLHAEADQAQARLRAAFVSASLTMLSLTRDTGPSRQIIS